MTATLVSGTVFGGTTSVGRSQASLRHDVSGHSAASAGAPSQPTELPLMAPARGSASFRGAPGDETRVETDEFDMYRIIGGRIHEIEGTADNARLRL